MSTPTAAILDRPPLRWPNGARVAVWLIPNIEYYELYPQPTQYSDRYSRTPIPEFLEYGNIDYGTRVGLYRLLDVFDRHALPAISVPVGLDQHGLPIGVQLVGKYGADELVVEVAYQLESALAASGDWKGYTPPIPGYASF